MRKHHAVRGRNYELLACVVIIQREGCLRANVYHKYELKYELVAWVSASLAISTVFDLAMSSSHPKGSSYLSSNKSLNLWFK